MKKLLFLTGLLLAGHSLIWAQKIPSPKEVFGFDIGDNYQLLNYSQTAAYFKKLAKVSDRVKLEGIGRTEEGRTQIMAVISSPGNLKNLHRYKEISQQLARAENLTDEEAENMSIEGKPVVWIDGGLHSTETVGSQQLVELYYQLLSRDDAETRHILDNVIILLCEANPDGMELVSDWYMQEKNPVKRKKNIPRKYNKYVGHDNNRDFFMMNMSETENISRQLFIEWMPQIVYDHHQRGPRGTVLAGPPYRGPFNYKYDPLIISGIDGIGAAMTNRLNREGKPGYTRLDGASFNTWWNGGLRSINYFHNMIGILTEITGEPAPSKIPVVPKRLQPNMATPYPVQPQKWNFKKSIDYSISLNYAVLNYAAKNGKDLLKNIYVMGKNSIQKGSKDSWTYKPAWSDSLDKIYKKSQSLKQYESVFRNPDKRDPRGYIIPANQADFPTAVKFVNAMIKSGIKAYKATSDFRVNGKSYRAGSYIIKTNQAFRPFVLDMFESQHYPNDFKYPGGPPIRPYDVTGWTLAYQMGVDFDRVLEGFDGPFEQIKYGEIQNPPVQQLETPAKGYLLSGSVNNSFIVVNDLLQKGVRVYRITESINELPKGSFYIPSKGTAILKKAGIELGTEAIPITKKPAETVRISPSRVALYDHYGGYSAVGWTRWLLDQYHFDYDLIFPQEIDKGNLKANYDIIIFIDYGIPPAGRKRTPGSYKADDVPKEYWYKLGRISTTKSIPALKEFVEKGGTIITVGRDTRLAYHFDLPVSNALLKTDDNGKEKTLSKTEFYIPASILKVNLNPHAKANWGLPEIGKVIYNNNPVFKINEDAANITPLASFDQENPLISGWAWGASYLKNGVAAFVADIGKGKFYAFGPEIIFRGQSQGTFKMLFNGMYQTR